MFLTSGQLYDLLSKAKKKATQTGSRGGRYYVSTEGSKIYTGEPSVPAPSTRPLPTLHHFVSMAPHSSQKTQSPVSVEAEVEVTKLPMRQRVVPAEQRFRPKAKITTSSRASVQEAMKRWPAYVCRSCRAVILPTFAKDTKRNQVDKIESEVDEKGVPKSWHVVTEEEGVKERYRAASKAEATQLSEDLRQHFRGEEPWQRRDDLIAVHQTKIEGEQKHSTLLEPGVVQPEMVGQKLCPDCFGKHEVISREVTGRTKIKHTAETRRVAHQKEKEQKQKERSIQIALKKFPGKRTQAEKQLVDEHEAIQRTRQRAEDERRKKEDNWGKKKSEEVWIEGQEQAALMKLRHQYCDKLIREGKNRAEAGREAANLTNEELSKFQQEQVRAHGKRREDTIKEVEAESGSRHVIPVFYGHEIEEHMERRRHEAPGGEERGVYRETIHPVQAKISELLRTARMRERIEEKEESKGKKIKKSLCVFLNKSIYQSAKSPEEAAMHRKWAEEDFSAPSPKIEYGEGVAKPEPKSEPKRDIHLELAHHLTHVYHHIDRGRASQSKAHEASFQHHWEAAHKLIQQGADSQSRHFDEVGRHHQRKADQLIPAQGLAGASEEHLAKRRYHSRMEGAASHLYHVPSIMRQLRTRISDSHGNVPSLYRLRLAN
jgi:hypothetical protein